jgi:hypothetical protein
LLNKGSAHVEPFSRRDFLRVGGMAAGGLTLADLLRLKAHGRVDAQRSHKAIMLARSPWAVFSPHL